MRTRSGTLLVLLAAVAVLAAGCGSDASPADPAATATRGDGSLLPDSPTALPEYDPPTFRRLLDELYGTPVVVNAWGSWCGPCRVEAPALAAVARRYAGRIQFLGLDVEDNLGPARDFVREFGWSYPSIFDPRKEILADLGFFAPPVTIVFDQTGNQVFVHNGPIDAYSLAAQLELVLQV